MYLENRLIAMLDVLGFASRIETRQALQATTSTYAGLIASARAHMFEPKAIPGSPGAPEPNFEFGQFVFDTLVLVSYPVEIKSAYRFIFATTLLMEKFFERSFPLRGAMGIGDFTSNEESGLFLSNAFKRLKMEEDNQRWSGCTVLPEAEDIVVPFLLGLADPHLQPRSSPLHYVPVPTKRSVDGPQRRWCLNWSYFLPPSAIEEGLRQMEGDDDKQTNTREYLSRLDGLVDDTQRLAPDFMPATIMKVMKARSGMRVKFEDDQGQGVNPGCSYSIGAYE